MMGHVCAKTNGKIFVAEDGGALVAKLPRARVDEIVAAGEGERFDPLGNGRPMKEWVRVEEAGDDPLSDWLALAAEARAFVDQRASLSG